MIFGKVAINFRNFERREPAAGRTYERWTHLVDAGDMIGKVRVGKSLVTTKPAPTRSDPIIDGKESDSHRGCLIVGTLKMTGERSQRTRYKVA